MKKDMIGLIALILTVIGAVNWGLVGLLDTNLVTAIFKDSVLAKIVYDLVGLSSLYVIYATWIKK